MLRNRRLLYAVLVVGLFLGVSAAAAETKEYAVPGTTILPHQYIYPLDVTVEEWQAKPPALYDPLPVAPGPDQIAMGPMVARFSPEGLPQALYFDRTRQGVVDSAHTLFADVQLIVISQPPGEAAREVRLIPLEDESGYERNNSYFVRRLARLADDKLQTRRLDLYSELISNGTFLYMYPRLYLQPGESATLRTSFRLEGEYRRVIWFEGDQRVTQNLDGPVSIRLDESVTKPFIMFEKRPGQTGVAIFLPVPPEVREWYHEYYRAAASPSVDVTVEPTEGGWNITFSASGLAATSERPHTFDFYYWIFPIQGSASLSLYQVSTSHATKIWGPLPVFSDPAVPGFWVDTWPNSPETRMFQALRYFAEEGYSFVTAQHCYRGAFFEHQDGAHVWGNQASNYKGLNFSGDVDHFMVRHLQLWLDKADQAGLPPYRFTCATMYQDFEGLDPGIMYSYHSAQEAEYMVKTALNFMKSGVPSQEDQEAIAAVINRMLSLLDPYNEEYVPNALVLPDGSYWYPYNEMETLRVRYGLMDEPWFVNNIHISWLNVIIDAARMNQHLGDAEAYATWLHLFRKGVDGLLYALQQERAWADYDGNELLYGINMSGPNTTYAQYLLYGMLPNVIEFAVEEVEGYRAPELVALLRRIMAGRWTAEPQYAPARQSAEQWLKAYWEPLRMQ